MSGLRVAAVTGSVLPFVGVVGALTAIYSGEGRADSYVFGSLVVALGCASVALVDLRGFPKQALTALWVAAMPLVAGASTGFALALVHPRVSQGEQHSTILGGVSRGLAGGVVLYPALIVGAVVVQLAATWIARRVRQAAEAGAPDPAEPQAGALP